MTPLEQGDLTPVFGLISIVPGLVLLVACANVANVLMVGHVSRRKEFAMRRAIGASRGRLIRQLLAESLVLALLSAAAGFALSFGLSALIEHYGAVEAGFAALLTPDRRALVATTAVAMLSTVVFGLLPAVTATRFDLLPALKDEGVSSTAARGTARWRGAFVVAQVALSLALVIVAGLFLQSMSKAMRARSSASIPGGGDGLLRPGSAGLHCGTPRSVRRRAADARGFHSGRDLYGPDAFSPAEP